MHIPSEQQEYFDDLLRKLRERCEVVLIDNQPLHPNEIMAPDAVDLDELKRPKSWIIVSRQKVQIQFQQSIDGEEWVDVVDMNGHRATLICDEEAISVPIMMSKKGRVLITNLSDKSDTPFVGIW